MKPAARAHRSPASRPPTTDPASPTEVYNYMNGLTGSGDPVVDPNGVTTKFINAGNPVTGEGWLDANGELISTASSAELRPVLADVSGGMRPKLEACLDAVQGGVTSAHIVDGRTLHSVLLELFTDGGIGTKITG